MKKRLLAALIAPFFLSFAAALEDKECRCVTAKLTNGWCSQCEVGYVASVKIPSYMLFEALDAHGHTVSPDRIKCESCQKVLQNDGFCERCKIGFVRKKAYFSRLTYCLARGDVKDLSKITCSSCRQLKEPGWCDHCKMGLVGNVAFRDRESLAQAAKEYRLLLSAVETLKRCEMCAVARFTGSKCPKCQISYRDGKRDEPQAPKKP